MLLSNSDRTLTEVGSKPWIIEVISDYIPHLRSKQDIENSKLTQRKEGKMNTEELIEYINDNTKNLDVLLKQGLFVNIGFAIPIPEGTQEITKQDVDEKLSVDQMWSCHRTIIEGIEYYVLFPFGQY